MLRSLLCAAAATVLSVLPAVGPAQAASDPSAGLQVHPEWGTITGQDGVLRRGCHTYTYSYAIQPPEGYWAIEVFISGPGLKHLAAGAFLDGYDPTVGTGALQAVPGDHGARHVHDRGQAVDRRRLRAHHRGRCSRPTPTGSAAPTTDRRPRYRP